MKELTFRQLREANMRRLPHFKNAKGEPAHSKPDGSDWTPLEWAGAALGELGEVANILKKVRRGDFSLGDARLALEDELADVQTYLDLLAYRIGIDLGTATIYKFNRVSVRVGSNIKL